MLFGEPLVVWFVAVMAAGILIGSVAFLARSWWRNLPQ